MIMIDEEQNLIVETILLENNKKIIENESLNDFLKSFKNYELTRLAITHIWVDENYYDLFKVRNLNNKPKKYIIEYITNNLKQILEAYVKIIDSNTFEFLNKVTSKGGHVKYSKNNFNLSLHFIMFIKTFAIGKVFYDKKEETIEIFIPKEMNNILRKALKDKEISSYNKKINKVYNYVEGVLEAYGIIPLTKLHELFEKQMFNINIQELNKIIGSRAMIDEIFTVYPYEDDMLVCSLSFTSEDEAIYFYENTKGEYYAFSKKEFELLKKNDYINSLDSYHRFLDYLVGNFDNILEDIDNIKNFLIMDYINSAQLDVETANKNFMQHVSKLFDVDEPEKKLMQIMIKNIFNEYPKWVKKGNK